MNIIKQITKAYKTGILAARAQHRNLNGRNLSNNFTSFNQSKSNRSQDNLLPIITVNTWTCFANNSLKIFLRNRLAWNKCTTYQTPSLNTGERFSFIYDVSVLYDTHVTLMLCCLWRKMWICLLHVHVFFGHEELNII